MRFTNFDLIIDTVPHKIFDEDARNEILELCSSNINAINEDDDFADSIGKLLDNEFIPDTTIVTMIKNIINQRKEKSNGIIL